MARFSHSFHRWPDNRSQWTFVGWTRSRRTIIEGLVSPKRAREKSPSQAILIEFFTHLCASEHSRAAAALNKGLAGVMCCFNGHHLVWWWLTFRQLWLSISRHKQNDDHDGCRLEKSEQFRFFFFAAPQTLSGAKTVSVKRLSHRVTYSANNMANPKVS